jgi:ABC-type nitrate/sulfonate/bicarbonate transport system substrate-binding protein
MVARRSGLALLVLALAAAGSQPAAAQTKVAIGYGPANSWIPAFVAKEQGIFARRRR